jgi:hypothetical protein
MKNIFPKPNSEGSTASAAMVSVAGSRGWAYERRVANRRLWRFGSISSPNALVRSRGRITTLGIDKRSASFSTAWNTPEQPGDYSVRSSGNIGQEVLDRDGKVVAWTTDAVLAHQIVRLLNSGC